MARRLPACDPCRSSKLSCDHAKPICARCRTRDLADRCSYRERPFKKRRIQATPEATGVTPRSTPPTISINTLSESVSGHSQRYPNPGYLGSSSHTTLFDHLLISDQSHASTIARVAELDHSNVLDCAVTEDKIEQGANFITRILKIAHLPVWEALVQAWVKKGINLPVAEAFTLPCANVACSSLEHRNGDGEPDPEHLPTSAMTSRMLFAHSCRPLTTSVGDTIEDFCNHFCRQTARWETLGVFFVSVSRATIDIARFDGLYCSEQERRALRKLAMQFSDTCLDIALSLDCLNDIQVILQYENFILHSLVDGDQSYYSWRRLGDVISSLFALGYHEQLGDPKDTPPFLRELRFVAFSRAYSADKNCSIFLGRPPRMLKCYCPTAELPENWEPNERFTYRADTRVHGICASLKEDILNLKHGDQLSKAQRASEIRSGAESQWAAIPSNLRLDGPLASYNQSDVEIDFLVSAKLNFTHVKFLLELTITPRVSNPGVELLRTSTDMLKLVVEAIILKQRLANSGTSLVWKVAYYGLAAAGVLCLALLYNAFDRTATDTTPSKTIRNLSVLVAEIETGALLQPEDPNYALLSGATRTIKNLLDRLITNRFNTQADIRPIADVSTQPPLIYSDEELNSWDVHGLQDFDPAFWLNLSEHPFLMTPEGDAAVFS